ncbi:hypothetical protein Misp01_33060 [Microtetraspora sp. NBRC 13810]|nr:hypothetical protein Misp01_33060 [Microtetraspora sp. NBRC 13810]
MQSLSYYSAITWLPTVLTDSGMREDAAGWMLSFFELLGIAGSLLVTVLAERGVPLGALAAAGAVLSALGFAGLLTVPAAEPYPWMALLGVGQGAAISLATIFVVLHSAGAGHAGRLSGMAHCAGYTLAATGPLAFGAVHQVTGGWAVPLLLMAALALPQAAVGAGAAGRRHREAVTEDP